MDVFVDLGAFSGSYINKFKKSSMYNSGFRIYAFECNPHLRDIKYGEGVEVIHKAAWITDGELSFFVSRKSPAKIQGSSVYKEKKTGNLDVEHPTMVQCCDFSNWLKTNFSPDDNIIVKMNIEGAEYDVLEKCIADGTIRYIKTAWILWHWKRCGIPVERHNAILAKLKTLPINLHFNYKDFT